MAKERSEAAPEDCWDVEAMYATDGEWQIDFDQIANENQKPHWPEIQAYQGRLGEGPATLKSAMDLIFDIDRKLSKIYTYAHLRHDEDIAADRYKVANDKIMGILHDFQEEISWFEPELLALPDSTLKEYLDSSLLEDYRFHLETIIRNKPHTLSADQEALLAMAGKALQAPHKAFSAINDADFKFGSILDSQGQSHELTHALYGVYLREHDRTLRKNAFLQLQGTYLNYENTLCELLSGKVQSHYFYAKAKKFDSCVEAALFPKNIDVAVYHALIQAVHDEIDALHEYVDLREKWLPNIDHLHLYDMYVPLTDQFEMKLGYEEAAEVVTDAVKPLGQEYQNKLRLGLREHRWVDRFENRNKRSGAYSSGCYDSMPYILMNYQSDLRDVFTLAHEAGHSMHSQLTHENQPYQYGHYSIFVAEVASTFNEDLLTRLLLARSSSLEEKIYLLTQKIEDIRATLFRQTMFAEFELLIHSLVEKNIPLTPALLKEEYRKLNFFYFGDRVALDTEALIEWARIPHFYYNFYVYQYATGISAALALAERVWNGGDKEREAYLGFLKAGCSRYPIEILQHAGVDMRSPEPVKSAIALFRRLVGQLKECLAQRQS